MKIGLVLIIAEHKELRRDYSYRQLSNVKGLQKSI